MKRIDQVVAMEILRAAGAEPLEPYPGVLKPWRSRCRRCQREVSPRLTSIKQGGGACRFCGSRRLRDVDAEALMRSAGLEPLEPYPGSKAPWDCRCTTCGTAFSTTYIRVKNYRACENCLQREVALRAETVMRNAGAEPLTEYPGTRTPWLCRCRKCGRQITPRHSSVRQGQRPCRYCSRKAIDSEDAVASMRNAGLVPLVDFPGVGRAWQCICVRCGQKVSPCLTSIRAGQGCRYCAGQVVDVEFADNLLRAAGAAPLVPYPGATKPWPCRCLQCGRTIRPRYNCVQQGQGPCRHCGKGGFDYDKPGSVYVLQHRIKGGGTIKVGVSNVGTNRLKLFASYGWELVFESPPIEGAWAYSIEQNTLRSVRNRGLRPQLRGSDMDGMSGATETFSAQLVTAEEVKRMILQAIAGDADGTSLPSSSGA